MLCASVKVSGITIRPPFGSRACAATTDSSSDKSRTGAAIASTAKDEAAALKGFRKASAYGATAGLNSIATLVTRGAISLSSSNHLPASEPTIAWIGLRLCVPDHYHAAQCRHGIPRGRWYRHRSAHYRLCTRHTFKADGSTRSPAVAGVRSQWTHGNPAADRLSHQGAHQPVVLRQAVPRSGCPRARLPHCHRYPSRA